MKLKKITRNINALSKKRYFYKMSFDNPVAFDMHLRITTHPTSATVKKMDSIFTKRIW